MKFILVVFLFITPPCLAQHWEAEIMGGISGYQGDLTQGNFYPKTWRPLGAFNLKYNINNSFIIRAGIAYTRLAGDDKYNDNIKVRARNLNFETELMEGTLCLEYNLIEPERGFLYPYIFAGVGAFKYDPYTYDNNNQKVFLQPLSTEGQGLPQYPDRKPYDLTQFCIPFGGGVKLNFSKRWDIIYEISFRYLFTDYLDDVSTTYINPQILLQERGPKAVELAYRANNVPGGFYFEQNEGNLRGNPSSKDMYYFTGLKLLFHFGKIREQKY